jgi:exodeoxyribonuclease V gamma subunit
MSEFTLHRAARIEALADALADRIRAGIPSDILAPVTIAVGSRGMERWLRNRLALRLPICANVAFPFPSQALSAVYGRPASDVDAWSPDALAWRLVDILPRLSERAELAPLRAWLERPRAAAARTSGVLDADTWSLAREVADVLDRAALFRPEWLRAWEQGLPVAEAPEWQGLLWREVSAAIGTKHPVFAFDDRPQPGDALHVFAVSSMPPVWLRALARASTVRPVHVYHLTPSQEYWGDTRLPRELRRLPARDAQRALEAQNPLLTAFGALARDAAELYLELPWGDEPDVAGAFDAPSASGSLLARLQSDVMAARGTLELHAAAAERPLSADDDSVQFHACHGPTRQVEALREALLELFDRDRGLEPRDVVVMTPDVATYAPLVRSVFSEGRDERGASGWGDTGGPRIPTYIADLGMRELNPLADVLLRVLELVDGRLTAPALADFAALDVVRRKFGFDDDDLARVRRWLDEAGARLGVDAEERARVGLPAQEAYTLAFALDRLALGVALADDGVVSFEGVAPYDEMEGDSAHAFGAFAELCARLSAWRRELRAPRAISAWRASLTRMVEELAEVSAKASFLRAELAEGLAAVGAEAGSYDGSVSAEALTALLASRFERSKGGDRLTSGAVTVCALAPMRSVPFKVVCLLGMDDGSFPRAPRPRAFDAVGSHPRRGDRDPREEDRNLLLEALLAARSHLLVFYTGRDPRTDKPVAPAVPIGDLLDVVDLTASIPEGAPVALPDKSVNRPRRYLTRSHVVQPFVSSGFTVPQEWPAVPEPRRYDVRMFKAAQALAVAREGLRPFASPDVVLPDEQPPVAVTIDGLCRWVRRPVRTLMRERLGLYLDEGEDDVPDREAFELDVLARSSVGRRIAGDVLNGATSAELVVERLHVRASVPPGAPGRAEGQDVWQQATAAHGELLRLFDGELPERVRREVRVEVPVAGGFVLLTGSVSSHADVLVRFGHDDPHAPKHLLPLWIELLALRAGGEPVRVAHAVGSVLADFGYLGKAVTFVAPSPADAMRMLSDLMALVLEARKRPVRLVEKCSFQWASRVAVPAFAALSPDKQAKTSNTARNAARDAWSPSSPDRYGEDDDALLALVFASEPPFGPHRHSFHADFEALATRLWKPIFTAMESLWTGTPSASPCRCLRAQCSWRPAPGRR